MIAQLFQQLGQWLSSAIERIGNRLVESLSSIRVFLVGIVLALLAPINWLLDMTLNFLLRIEALIVNLSDKIRNDLSLSSADSWWSAASVATSWANAYVPLDFAILAGGVVMSVTLLCAVIKLALAIYRLIPAKAT